MKRVYPYVYASDVNKNSDVSFHDGAGYLKYLDEQLPGNPLNSGIVFSFRTDQKDALLVYAHDQYDNIIQVKVQMNQNLA